MSIEWLPTGAPELYLHAHLSEPDVLVEKGRQADSNFIDRGLLAVAGELMAARLKLPTADTGVVARLSDADAEKILGGRVEDVSDSQNGGVIEVTAVGHARVLDTQGNVLRVLHSAESGSKKSNVASTH